MPALPGSVSLAKQDPNTRFVDQTITGVGHTNSDPKVPHDVIREPQVTAREELMDLLVGWKEISYRPSVALAFPWPSAVSL